MNKFKNFLAILLLLIALPLAAEDPAVVEDQPAVDDSAANSSETLTSLEEEVRVSDLRRYSSDDISRKNWNRALDELRELVTMRPYHADYHLTLGLIHRRLEDSIPDGSHLQEALRKYEEYADFGGEDAIAALLMAEAFAQGGERENAFEHLERAAAYGMNIARAVQQFPSLKKFTSDTRFVRAALRLERYNLSTTSTRDPFTGPWSNGGGIVQQERVGPFAVDVQREKLVQAREAIARVEYAIHNNDEIAAMESYGVIERIGESVVRFDQPELVSELHAIMERLGEIEEGIDQIRVAYLYESARSKMDLMKTAFEEQDFNLVNRLHGEVLGISQDIGHVGETYKAAAVLITQAADQFQQRSEIVREFNGKQVTVQGVVVSPEGSHAIIGGTLVPEGGQIFGGQLESVQNDRVMFRYRGELIAHRFGRFQ